MSFLLNTCEAEYLRDARIKKEDVQQLKEWVEKQPHMPKVSEYMLIQMLFASDYSMQRAKELAETYYEFRHTAPELFDHNDIMRTYCSCDYWINLYCFMIPKPTSDGHRIIYFGLRQYDPAFYHCDNCLRLWVKALITMIMEQGLLCSGYLLIYDLKGYTFAQMASINISTMKKYLTFSQDAIPLKVKSVYVINGHVIATKLDRIIRPFVKKEVSDKARIFSNMEDVYKVIGKECLPADMGGTLPETRDELNEIMKARMNALSPKVMEEMNLKTDESKRLHKKFDDTSRMDGGSFRKLEVD